MGKGPQETKQGWGVTGNMGSNVPCPSLDRALKQHLKFLNAALSPAVHLCYPGCALGCCLPGDGGGTSDLFKISALEGGSPNNLQQTGAGDRRSPSTWGP